MKQGSGQHRRGRSRGTGGRRNSPNRNSNIESNGPDGKVRGTVQQVLDKYLSLARDAVSAGEHIAAEGYFQHAEHYQRALNADSAANQARSQNARDEKADGNAGNGKDAAVQTENNPLTAQSEQSDVIASEAPQEAPVEDDGKTEGSAEPVKTDAARDNAVIQEGDDAELAASA